MNQDKKTNIKKEKEGDHITLSLNAQVRQSMEQVNAMLKAKNEAKKITSQKDTVKENSTQDKEKDKK